MMTAGLTMVAVIGVGRKGTQWDLRSYFDPFTCGVDCFGGMVAVAHSPCPNLLPRDERPGPR